MKLKPDNMYTLSVGQWNPFAGCKFDCLYCKRSFQAQLKRWAKKHCPKCYDFAPHEHPERLHQHLPKTAAQKFIFTCANSDISFCNTTYFAQIVDRIINEPCKTFLLQSKSPATFSRVELPDNIVIGTTIETNRDELTLQVSNAPPPTARFKAFLEIKHARKMITIEPVMDFDLNVLLSWLRDINPQMVWLGYNSRINLHLPEPELEKVKNLESELTSMGMTVILEKIRKAWWEDANPVVSDCGKAVSLESLAQPTTEANDKTCDVTGLGTCPVVKGND